MIAYLQKPGDQIEVIDLRDVKEEDEEWFEHHKITVTFEATSPTEFSIYGDVPELDGGVEETPKELTTIKAESNELCRDALSRLRQVCSEVLLESKYG